METLQSFKLPKNYLDLINFKLEKLEGFYLFSSSDIYEFLTNSDVFSIGFKKEKSQGYFYGLDLATLRRDLFNKLPKEIRLHVIKQKCDFLEFKKVLPGFDVDFNLLEDVIDIGMGHGVYKLSFNNDKCIVIKETDSVFPEFFNGLLKILDFPYIKTVTLQKNRVKWTVCEYLNGNHLTHYLSQNIVDVNLVKQLANHACIGDVFGRGDRHFENYLIYNSIVYPLDISYLFFPDNETWVDRYIKGGQAEFSVMRAISEKKELFWECYLETFNSLFSNKDKINNYILDFFVKKEAATYNLFVNTRLLDREYVSTRTRFCEDALIEFEKRHKLKLKLEEYVDQDSSILLKDPFLYMYYYANKDRYSAFFLIEYFNRHYLFDLF